MMKAVLRQPNQSARLMLSQSSSVDYDELIIMTRTHSLLRSNKELTCKKKFHININVI